MTTTAIRPLTTPAARSAKRHPAHAAVANPPRGPLAVAGRLLLSEWDKLWSVRSTWWNLAGATVGMIALAAAFTFSAESFNDGDMAMPPTELSLAGYQLAQLVFATLGVLVVTGEYGTGTIRTTFAATPSRWPVVLAKTVVLAVVVAPVALVAAAASVLLGQFALDVDLGFSGAGVARVVVGTALYLTAIALLGSAVGWLLRSTAAATSTLVALVLVLPVFGQLLPADWGPDAVRWLPSNAAADLMRIVPEPGGFGPWTGYAVTAGWVVVVLVAAVIRLRRQDA